MQWHQLEHMQTICTSLQTDNHTNISSLNFYRLGALPDAKPTVSKHWRQIVLKYLFAHFITLTSWCCKVNLYWPLPYTIQLVLLKAREMDTSRIKTSKHTEHLELSNTGFHPTHRSRHWIKAKALTPASGMASTFLYPLLARSHFWENAWKTGGELANPDSPENSHWTLGGGRKVSTEKHRSSPCWVAVVRSVAGQQPETTEQSSGVLYHSREQTAAQHQHWQPTNLEQHTGLLYSSLVYSISQLYANWKWQL